MLVQSVTVHCWSILGGKKKNNIFQHRFKVLLDVWQAEVEQQNLCDLLSENLAHPTF